MKKIQKAQEVLKEKKIDGWLLYDFHGKNPLARQFLELDSKGISSRRYYYYISKDREPVKLVHAIEPWELDHLPGKKEIYSSWKEMEEKLGLILKGAEKVAMEYSPKNAIPYVSLVDGGTIDLIRFFGVEVVSSQDLIAEFISVLTKNEIESHKRAAKELQKIVSKTWEWIHHELKSKKKITEYDAQEKILSHFKKANLFTDHGPIVAVNEHSADPHYAPTKAKSSQIQEGDFLLIDLWAKEKEGIFADLTKVAVIAKKPTQKQNEIFQIVKNARDAAFKLIQERFSQNQRIEGWEVDRAARDVIEKAGYGKYFIHRTGHNIHKDLHGIGANMDDLEMHDVRPLLKKTCFSVEPGIYLPNEFGVRLESDVLIHEDGKVEITGGFQDQLTALG